MPLLVRRPHQRVLALEARRTKGADDIKTYQKTELSQRRYCGFKPEVHVKYAETVLPMKDGLPKLKDFPAELGGSGQAVPE